MKQNSKHIEETKEVVHHINCNRQDNRIENLMVYSSTGEHAIKNHVKRNKLGRFCDG